MIETKHSKVIVRSLILNRIFYLPFGYLYW